MDNVPTKWTTNDEKNKQALSTLRVFIRLKKKDRQQQKEERSREEDRREGGKQLGSKEFFLRKSEFHRLITCTCNHLESAAEESEGPGQQDREERERFCHFRITVKKHAG